MNRKYRSVWLDGLPAASNSASAPVCDCALQTVARVIIRTLNQVTYDISPFLTTLLKIQFE